jgi:hypothetical protein
MGRNLISAPPSSLHHPLDTHAMTIDELADQALVEASEKLLEKLQAQADKAKKSAYFSVCVDEVLKSRQIRPELISELKEELNFAKRTGSLSGAEFYGRYRDSQEIREVGKVVFSVYRKHAGLPLRTTKLQLKAEIAQHLFSDFQNLDLI